MNKKLPKGVVKRSDGRYMGRFTYCGERYTLYNTDVKKLLKEMNDMRYEMEHGISGDASEISVNSWFEMWIKDYKQSVVKESTIVHFRTYYNAYIKKKLGKIDIHDIRLISIQKLYNSMAKNGYKENTIKKVNNILHNMFQYAVRNSLIIKNPCEGVMIPKTETRERRVLTDDEQKEFLEFVQYDEHYHIYGALFSTGFGTGTRIGELLALTWDDVEYEKGIIRIEKTLVYLPNSDGKMCFKFQTPKTQKSKRNIPLLPNIEKILRKHALEQKKHKLKMGDKWKPLEGFDNLIFTTEFGTPLDRNMINRTIKQIVIKINEDENREKIFEPFSTHTMRHSYATRCFENNIPARVTQEILGHKTLEMTLQVYTHVVDEVKQKEVEKLDYLFKEA